eukprot:TRINITY_DN1042_c0_g1_i2.p1 TRINITY_DN1042_c0_g1~~TRINITY_DN1042_c0_g1_i2.p1  ORF type:complete len:486 (-),score=109.57 TRINITY_DN1042_c0_g1_i2:176-1633(-)
MGIGTTVVEVIISVFQLVIAMAAGAFLAKLGPMDKVGESKFVLGFYYLFLPLFCFLEFAKTTDASNIANFGLLLMNFAISLLVIFLVSYLYCYVTKVDVRSMNSFIIVTAFGNVAFFPGAIVESLCDKNGLLKGDENCANGYGYCTFGIFMINIVTWGAAPYILSREKAFTLNIARQMYVVKQLYDSPQEFMADEDFSVMEENQKKKFGDLLTESEERDESPVSAKNAVVMNGKTLAETDLLNGETKNKDYTILETEEMRNFSNALYMDSDTHDKFQDHFNKFIRAMNSKVRIRITAPLPAAAEAPKASFKEIALKVLTPPTVLSVLGIVVGFIDPIKDALFSARGMQIAVKTLTSIGSISVPIGNMLLGCTLADGFTYNKHMNLRLMDLISLNIIKFIIIPSIGLAYMTMITHWNIKEIDDNRVLSFVIYSYWFVPPSIALMSIFVLLKHYQREAALLQFWANLITIGSTPVFIIIYFAIYPPP